MVMKFTEIDIQGFGVWSDLKLSDLNSGLMVFYGPNEAGKTTVMQFARAMLYGFTPEMRQRYLPPASGRTGGGSVRLDTPSGPVRILRRDDGSTAGQLRLESPDGSLPSGWLGDEILEHVDLTTFNNVFAVGIRELQQLDGLDDTQAAQVLYNLTTGLDRVSLGQVMRKLEAEQRRIIGPSKKPTEISELLDRKAHLLRAIDNHDAATRRYLRMVEQREELDEKLRELRQQTDRLQRDAHLAEVAVTLRDMWSEHAQVVAQLRNFGDLPELPDSPLERLDDINGRIHLRTERQRQHEGMRRRWRAEGKQISYDRLLCNQSPRILAIYDQQPWIASQELAARELEQEVQSLERRLTSEAQQLGLNQHRVREEAEKLSTSTLAALRPVAKALDQAEQQVLDSRRAVESWNPPPAPVMIAAPLPPPPEPEPEPQREPEPVYFRGALTDEQLRRKAEQASLLVERLARRIELDDRIPVLEASLEDAMARDEELFDEQVLPAWIIGSLGALFACGVAALLAGLLLPESVVGSIGSTFAWLGMLGVAAAVGTKIVMERSAARRWDANQRQGDLLNIQLRQAKSERKALDAKLPPGSGPLTMRLEEAEGEWEALQKTLENAGANQHGERHPELARGEARSEQRIEKRNAPPQRQSIPQPTPRPTTVDRQALHAQQQSQHLAQQQAQQQAHQVQNAEYQRRVDRLQQAESHLESCREAWKRVLRERGLSPDMPTSEVALLSQRAQQLLDLDDRLSRGQQQLRQHETALAAFGSRVHQIALDAQVSLEGSAPGEQVRHLRQRLAEQEVLRAQRRKLSKKIRKISRQIEARRTSLRKLQRARTRLLRLAGVREEVDFRRRAEEIAHAMKLRARANALDAQISQHLSGEVSEDEIRGLLKRGDIATLEEHWEQIATQFQQVEESLQHGTRQREELTRQLESLLDVRSIEVKRLELGTIEARFQAAVRRWQIASGTHAMLESLRKSYETHRQPETLRRASGFLEQLTLGHYQRVWTPLDAETLLVDTAEGKTLTVEKLSRGTREQLFLCLRLALVQTYFSDRGVQLPLVLDDVLVNFDSRRAEAAGRVLRKFASAGQQIMLFTCHEHIAAMFADLGVQVRTLSDHEFEPAALRRRTFAAAPAKPAPITIQPVKKPEPVRVMLPIAGVPETHQLHIPAPAPKPKPIPKPEPEPVFVAPPAPTPEPVRVAPPKPQPVRGQLPRRLRRVRGPHHAAHFRRYVPSYQPVRPQPVVAKVSENLPPVTTIAVVDGDPQFSVDVHVAVQPQSVVECQTVLPPNFLFRDIPTPPIPSPILWDFPPMLPAPKPWDSMLGVFCDEVEEDVELEMTQIRRLVEEYDDAISDPDDPESIEAA